jgi:hypothetical protein
MDNPVKKASVHGFPLTYEEEAKNGVSYLTYSLGQAETKVFFDQARLKGSAAFEDKEGRDYTLIYKNGAYILFKK